MSRLYAVPVLGRYGLTHGMLAWARCAVWSREYGAQVVAPQWFKLRIGPYLRRERDKRNYFLNFQPGAAISGPKRWAVLTTSRAIDVGPEWPEPPAESVGRATLVRFHNALQANEIKSFAQVHGHGSFLRQELLAITRARYRPRPASATRLAIHVRLGDFTKAPPTIAAKHLASGGTNMRLPLDWYIDRLRAVRAALGSDVPATVFSDGEDAELAGLLAEKAISRAPKQAAVTDLLDMGQSACVISSGSGFSLWGAFLGDAARLCYPGQLKVPALDDPLREIESGHGETLPRSFLAQLAKDCGVKC